MIAFTPHVTNGATVTLNVDGLGAKPLRSAPNTELLAGVIIHGTPYAAVYNNSDGAFYLQGFFGNPYNIPLAAGLDYWASTAPNSYFAFPIGQVISRITYASLFALIGTTYGAGDGSTTFGLPNKQGRVSAMIDVTGTVLSNTYVSNGAGAAGLGGYGGEQAHALITNEMPIHNHSISDPGHNHSNAAAILEQGNAQGYPNSGSDIWHGSAGTTGTTTTGISVQNSGGGAAHNNLQPTIMCNYIIRIL
jgi:microcystin-dependent protein